MTVDVGPVVCEPHPDPRGFSQEKFTSLVEDEGGNRWVTISAVVRRRPGQAERLAQVQAWSVEAA